MNFTYGYLKDAVLSKTKTGSEEATIQGWFNDIPTYCNDALIHICQDVKPKHTYYEVEVEKGKVYEMPDDFMDFGNDNSYYTVTEKDKYGYPHTMTDVCHANTEFKPYDYNSFIANIDGTLKISYDASWYTFDRTTDDSFAIGDSVKEYSDDPDNSERIGAIIPSDIIVALIDYCAYQCLMNIDAVLSQQYYNKYELDLSRIVDRYKPSKRGPKVKGGW